MLSWVAGHRARVPPDPIPNSEVKPCSVPRCIVVFGHEKPGKLAPTLAMFSQLKAYVDLAKLYNQVLLVLKRSDDVNDQHPLANCFD